MSLGPFHLSYLNWMQLLTPEDNIHAVCSKCACTVVSRVRIHSWFHARYLYSSSARLSFCPFICPSHSSTVSKRLNISSKLFNSRIASSFVLCDQISERNSNGFTPKNIVIFGQKLLYLWNGTREKYSYNGRLFRNRKSSRMVSLTFTLSDLKGFL